ncbi:MAG: MFS transporter [Clostridia bacterium]|nr:MFS transporter [Clostridia bacterium]
MTRPFGMRDKLGYLFGDFGNDFTFILASSFLMKYYTDVAGVDAAVIGVIMMAARFVDAFTDVTMGRICDRSPVTRHGRFRPWIRRMSVPAALSSFLLYQGYVAALPMGLRIAYLTVCYILWSSVFYTAVNIPYGSMASAISPEPDHRQSLSTWRSLGATFAGAFVGVAVPLAAYTTDAAGNTVLDGGRFTLVAGVCSLLAVACHLACYYLTLERTEPEREEQLRQRRHSVVDMLRNALQNRALISIIAASVVMLLSQMTMQSMAGFVFPNYYRSPQAQSVSTVLMLGGMLIAAALARPAAKRWGKAEVSAASCVLAAVVNLILFAWRPRSVWAYVGLQTVSWFGLGVFTMVSWALITDVIDDSELRTGVREDGSIYALYSFARKMGQAAAAGLSGALLSAIGYTQQTAFDPQVTEGIFSISTLAPALGLLALAAILRWWYPLRKKQVEENVAALKQRRGQ